MDYKKHYDALITRAKDRELNGYLESHHVVPRCMGGDDSKENVVRLTAEEHYIAHLLLVKMHPNYHGLVWAAIMMTGHGNGQRIGNKMYGWLRRRFQRISKERTGSKNGSYGTVWINKIGTTENKKIKKTDGLPEGWQYGRGISNKVSLCSICGKKLDSRGKRCFACHTQNLNIEAMSRGKLTWEKVNEIRALYATGDWTQAELCRKFNVTDMCINKIVHHHTWKISS